MAVALQSKRTGRARRQSGRHPGRQVDQRVGRLGELDLLMVAVVCLCCLGLIMAVSINGPRPGATPLVALKGQGAKLLAGLVAFFACSVLPLAWVRRAALPVFVIATALCWAALLFPDIKGAHRWIRVGSIGFQPVDFARFALIVFIAGRLADAGDEARGFRRGFVPVMGAAAVLAAGLFLQPDLGNAALALTLAGFMALIGGVRLHYFAIAGAIGAALVAVAASNRGYAMNRLITFFSGELSPQVSQSVLAISSGGVFGRGLGDGWMKMGFVPEARNDFVFAVIGEELGLSGAVAVLVMFALIGAIGYRLVVRVADPFARLLAFGFTFAICMQAAINLMVVTGLAPPKGIDLPFVSSGGTNLAFCLGAIGMVGNAARTDARQSTE